MIEQLKARTAELMAQGMRRQAAYIQANAEQVAVIDAAWRATLPTDQQ